MTRRELRETIHTAGRTRPMILEIVSGVAYVRPKWSRQRVPLSAAGAWQRAIAAAVRADRAARKRRP